MNRTMVKRGIGAAVLAIIAALLLGYLLKGKSQERQEVVDMNLPGTADVKKSLNIPSLKGAGNDDTVQNSGDASQNSSGAIKTAAGVAAGVAAGAIVASATGAADKVNQATKDLKVKEVAVNTFKNKGDDLDFTIRPPKGEKRKIVDNIGKSKQQIAATTPKFATSNNNDSGDGDIAASADAKKKQNSGVISRSRSHSRSSSSQGDVVASTNAKAPKKSTYRPHLVGEKKRSRSYGIVVAERSANESRSRRERRERKERREQRKAAKLAVEHEKTKAKTKAKKKAETKTQRKIGKGHYSVQLLATSSSSRANNLKKVMRKEGYSDTFVSKTARGGKVLYRVRVGNYSTRAAATSAQRNMKRRYKRNQAINSSIIVSR